MRTEFAIVKQALGSMSRLRPRVAVELLHLLPVVSGALMGRASQSSRRRAMAKLCTGIVVVAAVIASFLLVAPVIESATSSSTQFFQAVGTADGSGD